jgi:hypothetical protein
MTTARHSVGTRWSDTHHNHSHSHSHSHGYHYGHPSTSYTTLITMVLMILTTMEHHHLVGVAAVAPLLIGIPYTGTGIWAGIGNDTLIGAQIWSDYVDSIGGIGPFNQRLQLVTVNVGSTTTAAALNQSAEIVRSLIRGDYSAGVPIKYIISPYSSQFAEAAAVVVEQEDALMLTGGAAAESVFSCTTSLRSPCTQVNTRRFSHTVASLSPANVYLRPFVSLVKLYGASTMVSSLVITTSSPIDLKLISVLLAMV